VSAASAPAPAPDPAPDVPGRRPVLLRRPDPNLRRTGRRLDPAHRESLVTLRSRPDQAERELRRGPAGIPADGGRTGLPAAVARTVPRLVLRSHRADSFRRPEVPGRLAGAVRRSDPPAA